MDGHPSETWPGFLEELQAEILPLYAEHEKSFDHQSIHGRMHICRCLLFAEFMCRYYYGHTNLRPHVTWVRYAVAFHDSGRRGNGRDLWEADSAQRCTLYLYQRAFPDEIANAVGALITKDGGRWGLEKRIVHDADVLDIMRPCCGHGGRQGFRKSALRFLGDRDDQVVRDPATRNAFTEDAWELIQATEKVKPSLDLSCDYMAEVTKVLKDLQHNLRVLPQHLID